MSSSLQPISTQGQRRMALGTQVVAEAVAVTVAVDVAELMGVRVAVGVCVGAEVDVLVAVAPGGQRRTNEGTHTVGLGVGVTVRV